LFYGRRSVKKALLRLSWPRDIKPDARLIKIFSNQSSPDEGFKAERRSRVSTSWHLPPLLTGAFCENPARFELFRRLVIRWSQLQSDLKITGF